MTPLYVLIREIYNTSVVKLSVSIILIFVIFTDILIQICQIYRVFPWCIKFYVLF